MHGSRWREWLQRQNVKLWEAVALSCGVDPDELLTTERERDRLPKIGEIRNRLEIAKNGIASGVITPITHSAHRPSQQNDTVRLHEFVAWALSIGWRIPKPLAALAAANEPAYEHQQKRPSEQQTLGSAARTATDVREQRASPVSVELKALVSGRARHAANVGHKEDRDMRQEAIAWFQAHRREYPNKDRAAEAIAEQVVPAKSSTVRRWLRNI